MRSGIQSILAVTVLTLSGVSAEGQIGEEPTGLTYEECQELNRKKPSRHRQHTERRGRSLEHALQNLGFTGFCIDDEQETAVTEAAKRGLHAIHSALPFRGSAFPLSLRPRFEELLAQSGATSAGRIDTGTPSGAYRVYGSLPSPPSRPSVSLGPVTIDVPYVGDSISLYEGAVGAQANCLQCHSSVIAGKLHAGAMNTQLDQANLMIALRGLVAASPLLLEENDRQSQMGSPTAAIEREVFETYLNRALTVWIPAFSECRSKGDNCGPFAVWRTLARYEGPGIEAIPATTTAELDGLFDDLPLPTVDSNPWWLFKYKKSIYRFDDRSPDFSKHFATTFNQPGPDSNANHDEQVVIMDDVLSYIRQLPSPEYDRRINWRRVARGSDLFHGEEPIAAGGYLTCAECHGSYVSERKRYEVDYDPATPIIDVATDTAYSDFLRTTGAAISDPISEHLIDYFDGDESYLIRVPERSGYQSPPLDGAWASPPYLHNGSVPTLYALLKSDARPRYWQRSIHPDAYDHRKVGLRFRSLTTRQVEDLREAASLAHPFSEEGQRYRRVFDTTEFGKGNGGHTFGDAMNRRERDAVIEFIKSLYDRRE
jgi:hypothetical protein